MAILLTGATGFVGSALRKHLNNKNKSLILISRSPEKLALSPQETSCHWNDLTQIMSHIKEPLDIIHLAGEPIASGLWTKAKKKKIYDSRINSTKKLVKIISESQVSIGTFLCASAIGFYGYDRGEEILTEQSSPTDNFISKTCQDWETEANIARQSNIRVINLRIGLVLGAEGGLLSKLSPLFKAGLGSPLGKGHQMMSWIHREDLVSLISFCLNHPDINGAINAVSPHAVSNKNFTRQLSEQFSKKPFFPVPQWILKTTLQELSQTLLGSLHVKPQKAMKYQFNYSYPFLSDALSHIYTS